jgi:hypothetical protein
MRAMLITAHILVAAVPIAANWPQWRGPSGLGVSADSDLADHDCAREPRVERSASRTRIVVSDRLGRPDLRDVAGWPRARQSGAHPMLARDDAALVSREKPIEGTARMRQLPIQRFRRRVVPSIGWPPRVGTPHRGARPVPRSSREAITWPRRRPSPMASFFAWFGTGQIAALDMRGRVVWEKHLGQEIAVRHQLGSWQFQCYTRTC